MTKGLTMGAFDAKTHFSSILKKVRGGEIITITYHGNDVARLVPVNYDVERDLKVKKSILEIKKLRQLQKLGKDLDLKTLITEGRK